MEHANFVYAAIYSFSSKKLISAKALAFLYVAMDASSTQSVNCKIGDRDTSPEFMSLIPVPTVSHLFSGFIGSISAALSCDLVYPLRSAGSFPEQRLVIEPVLAIW